MSWLLFATVFLLPSYLVRFTIFGVPTTLLEVLIYLSLVALLVTQPLATTGKRLQIMLRRYGLPIGLFLLGAFIATAIAPDKRVALGLLKGYIIDPLILFAVIVAYVDTVDKQRRLLLALLASGLVVGISAILGEPNTEGRAIGLYSLDLNPSPNFIALYLTPIAALTLGLGLRKSDLVPRFFALSSFLVMTAAIIASGSRGGLLALGISFGLAVIWYINHRLPDQFKAIPTGLAILFIIATVVLGYRAGRPNFSATADHRTMTSNNLRYEIWRTTIVDIVPEKYLFGVGLGNYQPHFTEITQDRANFPEFISPWALTPHNVFLTIWTNLGLLGIIGFAWLLGLFFIDRIKQGEKNLDLAFALSLAMIALLIHGLVDSAYWKNDLSALFWTFLALGYSQTVDQGKEDRDSA